MFPEDVAIVSCVLRGHVFLISLKNIANLATRRLPFPIQLSNSQGSAGPHRWGRVPFVRFPLPEKMRGAERRQALVRIRRTRGPPRGRTHLGIARDEGRIAGPAPFGAPLRRSHYGVGPRFLRRSWHRRQPAPGRGSLCPRAEPRRRPGACCAFSTPAGAAPVRGPELPGASCRI